MIKKLNDYKAPIDIWRDYPDLGNVVFSLWTKVNEIIDFINKDKTIHTNISINAADPNVIAEALDKQLKESELIKGVVKKRGRKPKK